MDDLDGCVASVVASDSPELVEILIVENGSSENRDAPQRVADRYEKARVVDLGHNWGFSGGINRGVRACVGEWVMILNNDTRIDPAAIRECADVLRKEPPEVMGVAPKLLFLRDPHVIDAVGNAVNEYGAAFNVGIGQLDVGQYDRVERCFGRASPPPSCAPRPSTSTASAPSTRATSCTTRTSTGTGGPTSSATPS